MDAKDLRTETTINQRNNDGRNKYAPTDNILQYDRNKPYQDIGSNSSAKVDVTRPCAVIGPDRVVPPLETTDSYIRRNKLESWPNFDTYNRPPEYPHKLTNYQNPIRNISPRQTFQENMQRVMVPTRYTTAKINEEHPADRTVNPSKNLKHGVSEVKYCEVPYTSNVLSNEQKNLNNMPVTNMSSSSFPSSAWPSGNTHVPPRPYDNSDLYQYPDYASCAGPKSMPIARPIRTIQDDVNHPYPEPYYHTGNLRLKPYTTVKERYPPPRYELATYPNSYPHPPFPSHNYDVHKAMPPHLYNNYPQIPLKYIDNRICDPALDGYQRSLQQTTYTTPLRNQVTHSNYGPMPGACIPNKLHSFTPADNCKQITSNKIAFDHNKMIEYGNVRSRAFLPENFYPKDTTRAAPLKSQIMPNYPAVNLQTIHSNPYYRKDLRSYEYYAHFKGAPDPSTNNISRLPPHFSPKTLAISPSESNTSNETLYTSLTSQEDCGYASQSSTTSLRSIDSRMYNDYYKRYDYRYGPEFRFSSLPKSSVNANSSNKNKKNIDVRQFLQMWNEGDDEHVENNNKDLIAQNVSTLNSNLQKQEASNDKEQLYVLGLVNVPSDELCKYDHIQKISKLPDNIKGYNNIELLCQFEEAIESSKINNTVKPTIPFESQNRTLNLHSNIPRSISPLDVEAKISQSVIHKDVGCNFEIKPCSPKMLNVEVAAPIQSVTNERMIERVANPHVLKSPLILNHINSNDENCIVNNQDNSKHTVKILSCKMTDSYMSNDALSSMKSDYNFQDLEGNSGLCLASLPRLDNDIELNFPEVNQQFIKANQLMTESVITSNSPHNITPVEGDQLSKDVLKENRDSLNSDIYQLSPNSSEKSFTKLSKYRKNKTSFLESKQRDPLIGAQAIRTDSVIIKNPENCKNFEENNSPLSMSKLEDEQNKPINLTTQCYETMNSTNCNNVNDDTTQGKIDFSLNTSDNSNILNTEEDSIASSSLFSAGMFERSEVKLTDIDNGSKYDQNNLENLAKNILRDSEVNDEILDTCNPTDVHKEKLNLENTSLILSNELSMHKFENKKDILSDKSELLTYEKNDHVSYESRIPINSESLISEDFANIINCAAKDEILLPSAVSNTISYKDTKMVTNINENTKCYENNIESKSLFQTITNNVNDELKLTGHCITNNADIRITSPCKEKNNDEKSLVDPTKDKIEGFKFTESIIKISGKTLKTIHCANSIEQTDICTIMKKSDIESINTKIHENISISNNNCTDDEFQENKLESSNLYNDLVSYDLKNKEETVALRINNNDNINNDELSVSVPSITSNNVSKNSYEGKLNNDLTEKEEINDLIFNVTVTNNHDESKANTPCADHEVIKNKENEETMSMLPNDNTVKEIEANALLVKFQGTKKIYNDIIIKPDSQNEKDYAVLIENSIINNDETETNMLSSDISLSKKSCTDSITSVTDDVVPNENIVNNMSCENLQPANYSNYVMKDELKDTKENTPFDEHVINQNYNSQEIYELNKMEDMIKIDLEKKDNNVINKEHDFQVNTLFANIGAKNNFDDREKNLGTEKNNIITNDIVIVNNDESHTSMSCADSILTQNCHNDILIEVFKDKEMKNIFTEKRAADCDESRSSSKKFKFPKTKRDFIATPAMDESNQINAKINHSSKVKVTDNVTVIATNRKAVETYLDNNDKSTPSSPRSDDTVINSSIMIVDFSDSKDNIYERSVDNISQINTSCTKVVEFTNGNYIASHPAIHKENIQTTETKIICNDIEEDAIIDVTHINNTNFENNVINNFKKSKSKSIFVEINETVNVSDDILTSVANEKSIIDSSFHKCVNSICNNTKTMKCVEFVSPRDTNENVKENKNEINDGEKGEHMNSFINDCDDSYDKLYNESENYSKSRRVTFENNMGYRFDIDNTKSNPNQNLIIETKNNGDHFVMQNQVDIDKKIIKSISIEVGSLSSSVSTKNNDTTIENEDEMLINQHQPAFSDSSELQKNAERSETLNLLKKSYNKVCLKKELFSSRIQNLLLFNEGKTQYQLPFESDKKSDNNSNLDCRKVLEDENKKHLIKIYSKDTTQAKNIIDECKNKNSLILGSLVSFSTVTTNDYVEQQEQSSLENKVIDLKTSKTINPCNTGNKVKSLKELTEEIVAINNIQITDINELKFLHEVDINVQTNDVNSNVQLVEHRDAMELFSKRLKNIKRNKFLRKPKVLKRSLSDSALDKYLNDNCVSDATTPKKRKTNLVDNSFETELRTENLCSILHNNRRNSVAAFNNGDNVSFCILINNDYLIEEESETIAYPITSENVLNIHDNIVETTTINLNRRHESYHECSEDKSLDESWVDDVACVETVVTDDIAEDVVISASTSPTDLYDSDREFENAIFNSDISDHTDKVKYFYRDHMSSNDAQLVEQLYMTPQMDVTKTLSKSESQHSENYKYYDKESLVKVLSESNHQELASECDDSLSENAMNLQSKEGLDDKENLDSEVSQDDVSKFFVGLNSNVQCEKHQDNDSNVCSIETKLTVENICESSNDDVFSFNHDNSKTKYLSSSSPEVSSTTSEEKNSSIMLKITNYNGSRISHISDNTNDRICCKYTESSTFLYNTSNKPLITKAAQKYIPPIKETIRDLKVRLPLPPNSLNKFKQLKNTKNTSSKHKLQSYKNNVTKNDSKKPKPNFEDVLKGIEESQIKMHKEKCRKPKKSVPKVVIKKNEYGSHYASTSNNGYNPDLTGRKWQPWVFLEKNRFIDKMAIRKKTRAVYSHRKKTYVLIEKFYKYKAFSSKKFFISQPKSVDSSQGQLKCTIKLKQNC